MVRVPKWLMLLLIAVWLSATQHCQLEASGLALPCQSADGESHCHNDGCDGLESASYHHAPMTVKAPLPTLAFANVFTVPNGLPLALAEVPDTPASFGRPLHWVTQWRFVQRAAPPARAPAILA